MQLRPRNKLTSSIHANTYQDTRRKGDRPRNWSWHGKGKPAPVMQVNVVAYEKEQAHGQG